MSNLKKGTGGQEFRTFGAYIPPHARDRSSPNQPFARGNYGNVDHPYLATENFSATMRTYKEISLMPESQTPRTLDASNMAQYMGPPAENTPTPAPASQTAQAMQTTKASTQNTNDDGSNSDVTMVGDESPPNTAAHSNADKRRKNKNKRARARARAKAKKQAQAEQIREQASDAGVAKSESKPASEKTVQSEGMVQAKETSQPEQKLDSEKSKVKDDLKPADKLISEKKAQSEPMVQSEETIQPDPKFNFETKAKENLKPKDKPASKKEAQSEHMVQSKEMSQPDQILGSKNKVEDVPEAEKALTSSIEPQSKAGAITKTQPEKNLGLSATTNAKFQSEETLRFEQKSSNSEKRPQSSETAQTEKMVAAPSAKSKSRVKAQPEKCVKTEPHLSREPQQKHAGESFKVQDQVQRDGKSDLVRIFGPLPVGSSKQTRSPPTHQTTEIKKGNSKTGRNTIGSKALDATAKPFSPAPSFDKEGFEAAIGGCPVATGVYKHIYEKSGGDLSTAVNLYLNEFQPGEFQTVRRRKGRKLDSRSHHNTAAKEDSAYPTTTAGPSKTIATKSTSIPATTGASNMKPTAPSYAAAVAARAPVSSLSQTVSGNQNSQRPGQANLDTKMDTTAIATKVNQQQKLQQRGSFAKSDHRIQLNPSCNSPLNQAAKMQGKHAREKSSTSNFPKLPAVVPALPRVAHPPKKATANRTDTTANATPQKMPSLMVSDSTKTPTAMTAPKLSMAAPNAAGVLQIIASTAVEPTKAIATATTGIADDDKTSTPAISQAEVIQAVARLVDGSLATSSTSSAALTSLRDALLPSSPPKKPDGHNKCKFTKASAEAETGETTPPKLPSFTSTETENKDKTPQELTGLASSYESAHSQVGKDQRTLVAIQEELPDVLASDMLDSDVPSRAAKDYKTIHGVDIALLSTLTGGSWDDSAEIGSPEANEPVVAQSRHCSSTAETGRPVSALGASVWDNAKDIGAETMIAASTPTAVAAQDGAQDEEKIDDEKKGGDGHKKKTERVVSTEEKPLYISGNTLVRPGYAIEGLTALEKSTCITWEEATGRRTPRPVPWTEKDWAEYPASNTPSIRGPAFLSEEVRHSTTFIFPYLSK